MNNGNRKLPLRERLELAKRSQASSPETAAALVERFSRLHPAKIFAGKADCDLMYDLTGTFWDELDDDSLKWKYRDFCGVITLAMENDFDPPPNLPQNALPIELVWGKRVNDALVLLGLMLLDHAKCRRGDKSVYRCTRMTMEQYLDALETVAYPDKRTAQALSFRAWREDFQKQYNVSEPLADVLAAILRSYMEAWQEFDHLDHLLRCMGALACYLEDVAGKPLEPEQAKRVRNFRETLCMFDSKLEGWELLEVDKRYDNPEGYFFALAMEYPDSMPDPGDSALRARSIRNQIFLPRESYEDGLLGLLAELSPSPDLGDLLKKYGNRERLLEAMEKIHLAGSALYMLWVEPYLWMRELRVGELKKEGLLR